MRMFFLNDMKKKQYGKWVGLTLVLAFVLFATAPISAADVKTSSKSTDVTSVLAAHADKQKEELQLVVPEETDNPNYEITFVDPSGDGVGVVLIIDGGDEEEISSPYALPALSIGQHELVFKYVDKLGAHQELSVPLVIIPRAPSISSARSVDEETGYLTVHGSAPPLSRVELLLIGDSLDKPLDALVDVGADGKWEHTFEEPLDEGKYMLFAQTKKQGFRSKLSAPLMFSIALVDPNASDQAGAADTSAQQNDYSDLNSFDLRNLNTGSIKALFNSNKDMNFVYAFMLLLGIGLGVFLTNFISSRQYKQTSQLLQNLLSRDDGDKTGSKNSDKQETKSIVDKLQDVRKDHVGLKGELELPDEESGNLDDDLDKDQETDKEVQKSKKKNTKQKKSKEQSRDGKSKAGKKAAKSKKEKSPKAAKKESKADVDDANEGLESKTVSKEEFLKKFKKYDPDKADTKGNKKRNIKITLTSATVDGD